MKQPLSFRNSFWLFIRNIRRYGPEDQDFGSKLGISQVAAITATWAGLFVGCLATVGSAYLLARPLINLFWPTFIVAMLAVQFLVHSLASYAIYRFWYKRTHAEA